MTARTALQAASAFYEASPGMRFFRMVLGSLERWSPALGVRAARRLFCTPLPTKFTTRRAKWSLPWRTDRWDFENASVTLYSLSTPPDAPVVLLVHGWGGHARQMLALGESLAQQGLRPVLLELPAHGHSDGFTSNLPQFGRAIDYVCSRLAQEGLTIRAVIAHSLAANAAAYAASRGLPAERLVLIAPLASPREYTRLFAQIFGLKETTRLAMQERIEADQGVLIQQFESVAVGPRIRMPTLIVHDRGDSINAFADGQAFAQAIRGARFVGTEGLGHRKVLKDAHVLGQVAIFTA